MPCKAIPINNLLYADVIEGHGNYIVTSQVTDVNINKSFESRKHQF